MLNRIAGTRYPERMTSNHPNHLPRKLSTAASLFPDGIQPKFLEGLSEPDVASVVAMATRRRLPANSLVSNQGDPADYFFLIVKGCARFFFHTPGGRKVILFWLAPGDGFGGASLLPQPTNYLVSAETVKDSVLLVWHRSKIRELTRRYPLMLENALCIASDYFAWYLATHNALISHDARERLASVVTSLAEGVGHKVPGGVRLDITNEQLANAANVTPFTASRVLNEWQRSGALAKSRGSIVLRAPQQLLTHQV